MNKLNIVVINYDDIYIKILTYYFRNINHTIVKLNEISKIDINNNLIIFNKNTHLFKNINIENINYDFCYLNNSKDIIYIAKNNYILNNNNICIKNKTDIILEYFDIINDYNVIDHENYKVIDENYLEIYKKYKNNSNVFYNKIIPIKSINTFIELEKLENFYHLVVFLNDDNIYSIIDLMNITYKNMRISIFIKKLNIENTHIINMIKHPRITIYNNFNCYNILVNNILYFENIVFFNNMKNIDYQMIFDNMYLKHYMIIIKENYFIIPANIYVEIPYIDNNLSFLDMILKNDNNYNFIYSYIFNKYKKDIYIEPKIKNKFKRYTNILDIPINFTYTENKLLNIKDYKKLLLTLNDHININTNDKTLIELNIKKISVAILTEQESILNTEIVDTLEYISDKDQLITIGSLIDNLPINKEFNNIKNTIYIKLLTFFEEDMNKYLYYINKLLKYEHTKEILLSFLTSLLKNYKYIELLSNINKNKLITFIILSITKLNNNNVDDIITLLNKILSKIYNINDIMNIDNIIKLNNTLEMNNVILITYLLNISSEFNSYNNTINDFIKERNKIKENYNYLKDKITTKIPLDMIINLPVNNFHLAYQGIPSVDIYKLKCMINRHICPELNYKIDTNYKNNKIKILFHAQQLNRLHSVYKDRHQVINKLSLDNRFDVHYSTFEKINEDVKYTFGNAKHILLPQTLSEIKTIITAQKFDIICYCEIGMYPLSYYMAHLKMAKIQCNTWGHSDTSGIDTIDYYFSSKLYELPYEEAQTHYSEKLILQNSLCTSYINPLSKHNIKDFKIRSHYGFTDEVVIYFCAQSLFKLNPQFDDYIVQILTNVSNSVLILLDNNDKNKVIERFNNKNVTHKFHFFPGQAHFDYMNLMNISDVALDVYPFGGCNSSFEAFSLNIPIVTQPSVMINGRFTSGFYKKMGLEKYICNSKKEYTKLAIKLGTDKKYRNKVSNDIKEKNKILFEDMETIQEWKNDLIKIYANII